MGKYSYIIPVDQAHFEIPILSSLPIDKTNGVIMKPIATTLLCLATFSLAHAGTAFFKSERIRG